MAGRSGDGVELNVFVLRRALHDSIEAEESLEQGKLEFRDAKSGSVSSWAKRREGGGVWTRWVEDEGRKPRKTRRSGGIWRRRASTAPEEGIFTAIFSTTYPQIPCPNL